MTLTDQIADLLTETVQRVGGLLGSPELTATDVEHHANRLAGVLTGDDDHARAETAADLYVLVCGQHDEPRADWWATPLGRAVATSIGRDDSEAVTAAVAAQMLGIARQSVYRLAKEGKVDQHPDGGLTRASVMARLATAGAR